MASRAERAYNKAEVAFSEAKKQKDEAYTVYLEAYNKKEAAGKDLSEGYTKERLTNYLAAKEAFFSAAYTADKARNMLKNANEFAELKMRQMHDFNERDAWRKGASARKAERLAAAVAAKAEAEAEAEAKAVAEAKIIPPVLKPLSQQQVTDLGSLVRSFLGF